MRLRVVIWPQAELDIADGAEWYDRQQPDVGDAFLAAVGNAADGAATHPFGYPCLRRVPEVRRVLLSRFPWRIFYIRRSDAIIVFGVLHAARHDREWMANAR